MNARVRLRATDDDRWSLRESRSTGVPEHLVWRRTRIACRISQTQLAERVGVSAVAVSDWELARHRPSRGNRIALCDALERLVSECALSGWAHEVDPTQDARRPGRPRLDGVEVTGRTRQGAAFVPARETSTPRKIAIMQALARLELDGPD